MSLWEQIFQPFIFSRRELFSFFRNYGMTYLMLWWKRLRTLEVSWIITCLSSSCFGGTCALFTLPSFYREWLPTQRLGMLGWVLQGGGSDCMDTSQIPASTPRHPSSSQGLQVLLRALFCSCLPLGFSWGLTPSALVYHCASGNLLRIKT